MNVEYHEITLNDENSALIPTSTKKFSVVSDPHKYLRNFEIIDKWWLFLSKILIYLFYFYIFRLLFDALFFMGILDIKFKDMNCKAETLNDSFLDLILSLGFLTFIIYSMHIVEESKFIKEKIFRNYFYGLILFFTGIKVTLMIKYIKK